MSDIFKEQSFKELRDIKVAFPYTNKLSAKKVDNNSKSFFLLKNKNGKLKNAYLPPKSQVQNLFFSICSLFLLGLKQK